MDVVYLDNNATTQPAAEVGASDDPVSSGDVRQSIKRSSSRPAARQAIDEARAKVASLLNCADSELLFTGCGTESINTAMRGILAMRGGRKRIVTSTAEHSATRELCLQLAKEGFEIIWIDVDQRGALDMDRLKQVVDDSVAVVSIMWANNETGVIFPVEQIGEICRAARVPFHCDATQAVGKIPVDLKASRHRCCELFGT